MDRGDNNTGSTNNNSNIGGSLSLGHLSVFNRNEHFLFIYKKTEKLVTAVYMITNFVKDGEPLKWRIRERALELLGLNMSFTTVSLSERKELLREYQAISIEIVSLISVAYHSGLISEMNWSILKKEFEALVDVIEHGENRRANEETVIISPDFFGTSPASLPERQSQMNENTNPGSKNTFSKGQTQSRQASPQSMSFKPKIATKIEKDNPSTNSAPKGDRRSIILSILTKRGGLSVKDFTDAISGVSEKTIQRELLSLVAEGTIKKEGERRWSRYFIAQA